MRRTFPIWIAATVLSLCCTAPALGAGEQPQLTQLNGARFPARSFVLTLPEGRTLQSGTVHVRENDRSVSRLSVVPARAVGGKGMGVVLVMDASASMRGRAITSAVAAARVFVARRNPQQQIGMVTFSREARVALPLTADQSAIDAALASTPTLGNGTHLYDAVDSAITMLQQAHIKAGSIVVLSDGADTQSQRSAADVAARAQAAGVRIFSVGLRSRAFDRHALKALAAAGHGDYSETRSSTGLGPIYAALGSRLANEYVVRYRSLSELGATVRVQLTAPGLAAASFYVAPPAPLTTGEPAAKAGFWGSSVALVIVSFLCAFLIGLIVVALVALRPKGRTVRQRVEGFVPAEVLDDDDHAVKSRVLVEAEKSLSRTRWWASFNEELEIGAIKMPAVRFIAATAVGTLIAVWLLTAITGSALGGLLGLATPFCVWTFVSRKADRQRKLFAEQLADNLQVIASAMRAGHSFVGALSVAVQDSPEPARSEFQRAVTDEKLGVPLDETLGVVARRMKSTDLEQVTLVSLLQRETGGGTAEVIDRVSETIRERAELRRTVQTLTAQGRMARWIVSAIPPGLLIIISAINSEYMQPLFHTSTGHVLLVLGAGMVIAGSLVIKRIVNIEV
jgi:tight adherence protein B